jgi:hypothetical protein
MRLDDTGELRGKGLRFWAYWVSAAVSTLLFLYFMAIMLTVPGIVPSTKIWMLSVAGVLAAISLGVGTWRFDRTDAPAMVWPLGSTAAVALLLEVADCAISVFQLATRTHP